jgi:Fe-S cluster biogenesis protein NfuA/nitrite reductase/ring-hydroxylating ferredoxin subunit
MAADPAAELVERVEELTARLEAVRDPHARAVADELVASVIQLYGAGLERIVAALDAPGASAADARAALVEDGIVASLLLIHDLYPVDLETRVREALDSVRPYMESHGGDVEILSVRDGVARLRLVGHCDGCPASESTLELAIKRALEETAPDLDGLEVEGVSDRAPAGGFELPLVVHGHANGNGTGGAGAAAAWTELEHAAPGPGQTVTVTAAGADLLVANVGGTLLAYRNECGWCRGRLDTAAMTRSGTLTCPSCERRYELRRAGRSPDDELLQVEPVPLLRGQGRVRVAVPA